MEAYADLGDLSEDERIAVIGRVASEQMKITGFIVEDNDKADRYIRKLTERFKVRIICRGAGPIKDTVFVKVGPLTN